MLATKFRLLNAVIEMYPCISSFIILFSPYKVCKLWWNLTYSEVLFKMSILEIATPGRGLSHPPGPPPRDGGGGIGRGGARFCDKIKNGKI